MLEELHAAINDYTMKWQGFAKNRQDIGFFEKIQPTAVGWKTEDLTDFIARFDELQALCDQVHLGWVDERWLATMHLRDEALPQGITLVKLMQRRPESTDATGLDHIDFLLPNGTDAKVVLQAESEVEWTEEFNGDHCKWISIWFDNTEAKLRSDTVLQVCADEMLDLQESMISSLI
jgi:hypothetical protein